MNIQDHKRGSLTSLRDHTDDSEKPTDRWSRVVLLIILLMIAVWSLTLGWVGWRLLRWFFAL